MSKIGFGNYVRERISGFDGPGQSRPTSLDARRFPGWAPRQSVVPLTAGSCVGPVAWKDFGGVEKDVAHLQAALAALSSPPTEVFMPAVSPGTVVNFFPNQYYPDRVAFLAAVAGVMRREYAAILDAGFLLQLDCPDLALNDIWFPDLSVSEFRTVVEQNIDAINQALTGLPADRVRLHVCWGSGERPNHQNVPLADIVDLLLQANIGALSIAGANGRHEHEYHVWENVKLPDNMLLIPGVIDSTSNIVEHPEVVAERIIRYAAIVGKENVIAGSIADSAPMPWSPRSTAMSPSPSWKRWRRERSWPASVCGVRSLARAQSGRRRSPGEPRTSRSAAQAVWQTETYSRASAIKASTAGSSAAPLRQ